MILKPCLRRLLFTNGRDFPAVLALATDEPPRSAAGSRYLERILTVSETCRQQGRNALSLHAYDSENRATIAVNGYTTPQVLMFKQLGDSLANFFLRLPDFVGQRCTAGLVQ